MEISLPTDELKGYLSKQLALFFPDKYRFIGSDIDQAFKVALERTEYCFKHIILTGYNINEVTFFSHLHSDQYSQFLYFFANSLWRYSQNKPICDKVILLNKMLNGMFCTYKCCLPDIFLLSHPVGTVLGNAHYDDFLVVQNNVTVNTTKDGFTSPVLGKGVYLATGSIVIGNNKIGDRTSIGAKTLIFNRDIPNDSIAFTDESGSLQIKERSKSCLAQSIFNVSF